MFAINFTEGLESAWSDIATFVPLLALALFIFLVGYFIAKAIQKVVLVALKKLHFDDAVDKSGLGSHLEKGGYADSGILLAKIVYWAVMIMVIKLALSVFGTNEISDVLDDILAYLPKIFVALIIVVLTGVVASKVKELVGTSLASFSYGVTLATLSAAVIWFIGGFAAIDQLEVARDTFDTLFKVVTYSLGGIAVIAFGVGGIEPVRDNVWKPMLEKLKK